MANRHVVPMIPESPKQQFVPPPNSARKSRYTNKTPRGNNSVAGGKQNNDSPNTNLTPRKPPPRQPLKSSNEAANQQSSHQKAILSKVESKEVGAGESMRTPTAPEEKKCTPMK